MESDISICQAYECKEKPIIGTNRITSPLYCEYHDLKGQRKPNYCYIKNCESFAKFGLRGDKARFCLKHSNLEIHIDIAISCHYPGCLQEKPETRYKFCMYHYSLPLPQEYINKVISFSTIKSKALTDDENLINTFMDKINNEKFIIKFLDKLEENGMKLSKK